MPFPSLRAYDEQNCSLPRLPQRGETNVSGPPKAQPPQPKSGAQRRDNAGTFTGGAAMDLLTKGVATKPKWTMITGGASRTKAGQSKENKLSPGLSDSQQHPQQQSTKATKLDAVSLLLRHTQQEHNSSHRVLPVDASSAWDAPQVDHYDIPRTDMWPATRVQDVDDISSNSNISLSDGRFPSPGTSAGRLDIGKKNVDSKESPPISSSSTPSPPQRRQVQSRKEEINNDFDNPSQFSLASATTSPAPPKTAKSPTSAGSASLRRESKRSAALKPKQKRDENEHMPAGPANPLNGVMTEPLKSAKTPVLETRSSRVERGLKKPEEAREKLEEGITIDEAVRLQTARHSTGISRPIERAVSVHQRGPFKYELNDFVLQKGLGQGAFAKVYLVKRHMDGRLFALKSMRKDRVVHMRQVQHVQNERHLMEKIHNPFLVGLEATFQDSGHIYMIIEYMPGGDLFSQIRRYAYFEEPVARFYASEVAMALSYLHSENIIYRDLKPENVLLDADGHIKLGDFGFAKVVDGTTRTFCGTPSYICPEILMHKEYTSAVDWWSFGVLLFEMLSGCSPFQESTAPKTYERILQGRIQWPSHRSKYFSRSAEHLITSLLVFSPHKRLGCVDESEIRDHPFFATVDWRKVKSRKQRPLIGIGSVRRSSSFGDGFCAGSDEDGVTQFEISAWRSGSWTAGGAATPFSPDLFKDF
ncbi:AGC/PKA protein kinase [Spizellomyces punctatus DAOM BR117]|uniref:cAMP-dependent protein kinase n=1 Tax=Spizellomyces punctatus (strain DAOM BR117) TaxID=645134 RepID=A0A0L0HFI4_SPIPD|nr:AGC/PKA protein kinase [Spizellomyces punctatus DAOM BR117]KNC99781.1 AGC/PKA protein kinase [Spizellomyces punctatus DAOM BR117]|eukprot:XP_016607821.1 AGC/PKA protein kinase [Spizellomyces punctatus DAOM BR117]